MVKLSLVYILFATYYITEGCHQPRAINIIKACVSSSHFPFGYYLHLIAIRFGLNQFVRTQVEKITYASEMVDQLRPNKMISANMTISNRMWWRRLFLNILLTKFLGKFKKLYMYNMCVILYVGIKKGFPCLQHL